jgi:hypothetical protein
MIRGQIQITFDQRLTEIQEFDNEKGNGFWLPVSFEYTTMRKGEKVKISKKIESDKTHVNFPTTRSMFRIIFPPGTTITDSVIGMTYQIPGDEIDMPSEKLLDELDNPLKGLNYGKSDFNEPNLTALDSESLVQSDEKSAPRTNNSHIAEIQNKKSYALAVCIAVVVSIVITASLCYARFFKKVA